MKHGPHCIPPDEVGAAGMCCCDGAECPACGDGGWVFGRGLLRVPCSCGAGVAWQNRPHPRDAVESTG